LLHETADKPFQNDSSKVSYPLTDFEKANFKHEYIAVQEINQTQETPVKIFRVYTNVMEFELDMNNFENENDSFDDEKCILNYDKINYYTNL
jgi:hypothetical protein